MISAICTIAFVVSGIGVFIVSQMPTRTDKTVKLEKFFSIIILVAVVLELINEYLIG